VPNILSDSDTLVNENKRQKPIRKDKLELWLNKQPEEFCENSRVLDNYKRNQQLIDFDFIPKEISDKILAEYSIEPKGSISKVFDYFMANRMQQLLKDIQQFQ
jgi:hypothetical protein